MALAIVAGITAVVGCATAWSGFTFMLLWGIVASWLGEGTFTISYIQALQASGLAVLLGLPFMLLGVGSAIPKE